jgi:hypothetical protein
MQPPPFLVHGGRVAVCVFSNAGYMHYVHNLMANLQRIAAPWRPMVLCADAEAAAACQAARYMHAIVPPPAAAAHAAVGADGAVSPAEQDFNAADFNKLVFRKLDALAMLLGFAEATRGQVTHVVYLDADIVLFADPLPALCALHGDAGAADVLAQCDEKRTPCCATDAGFGRCAELCTGLMSVRVNERSRALFDYAPRVTRPVAKYQSDQAYVNEAVGRGVATAASLPRHLFPNGAFLLNGGAAPRGALLLHYNWLVGGEKQKRMAADGRWFVASATP